MRNVTSWIAATLTILLCFVICLPAPAAGLARRPLECRIISRLHDSIQPIANSLTSLPLAEKFAEKLAEDMKALSLQDVTLQKLQSQFAADFHEMSLILHNIHEGELVRATDVYDRMAPFYKETANSISTTSKELNSYCKGVWGFTPIPE